MSRQGQAALEFITTYGWAVLVILVMIGAITYFGILNPSKFLPNRCQTSPEFNCQDYQIKSDGKVSIVLQQTTGKTIILQGLSCNYNNGAPVAATMTINGAAASSGSSWSPRHQLTATCDFGAASTITGLKGQKVKVLYNVTYQTSSGGLSHLTEGEIYSEVTP
jgi:hypothetical protein